MRTQTFGVEIELTGLERSRAAGVIAHYFVTESYYIGGVYDAYGAKDSTGREWKVVRDSSIVCENHRGNRGEAVEVVTPILHYEDIETLQEIVRLLRKAGAIANSSCGIHVHVGAEKHNARTLRNLVNIWTSKQDIIYKALSVGERRTHYCKKLEISLSDRINKTKPQTLDKVGDIWYDGYGGNRMAHYNSSRYHGLNLHSVFTKGTVEFRCFNSTTHAGRVKTYIQFCLAVNNQALTLKNSSAKITTSTNEKYTFRCWLLRMGLIGDEFKTARMFLLENLEGDIAWRNAESA